MCNKHHPRFYPPSLYKGQQNSNLFHSHEKYDHIYIYRFRIFSKYGFIIGDGKFATTNKWKIMEKKVKTTLQRSYWKHERFKYFSLSKTTNILK